MVLPFPTVGPLVIVLRSGTQSDPCISSVATAIMITTSNSSVKRSGLPNQLLDVLLHTTAWFELARVRTELFHSLVIPSLARHPIQSNRQAPRHRHLLVYSMAQANDLIPRSVEANPVKHVRIATTTGYEAVLGRRSKPGISSAACKHSSGC
jgi:hypothetical protein